MAQRFYAGQNSNDWTEWTTEDTSSVQNFRLTAGSALGGTAYGVAVNDGSETHKSVTYNVPINSNRGTHRVACRIDRNTASVAGDTTEPIVQLTTDAGTETDVCRIGIKVVSSVMYAFAFAYDDGAVIREVADVSDLPSGDVTIEARLQYASSVSANDGELELYVNGVSVGSRADIDIYNNQFDTFGTRVHLIASGTAGGVYYVDEIYYRDDNTQIYPPSTGLDLAAMTKPASISADGLFIYVALLDSGNPILTKISTALDTDGTTVFNPGSGSNIGVECGRFDADVVWIAGAFDSTNVIEKSENAGTTFSVKDNAAIGNIRTFVLGPDSDIKLLVYDETNNDILETINDGTDWNTINAGVTQDINDIGRLGINTQETVLGNQGAASNSIQYSVNSGDDLEDYQTGVYPNSNATKVIVN